MLKRSFWNINFEWKLSNWLVHVTNDLFLIFAKSYWSWIDRLILNLGWDYTLQFDTIKESQSAQDL